MKLAERVRRELGTRRAKGDTAPARAAATAGTSAVAAAGAGAGAQAVSSGETTRSREAEQRRQRRLSHLRSAIQRMESRDRPRLPTALEPMEMSPPKPSAAALAQRLARVLGVGGAGTGATGTGTGATGTGTTGTGAGTTGTSAGELPTEPMPESLDGGIRYIRRFVHEPLGRFVVEPPDRELLTALDALVSINRAWRQQRSDDPSRLAGQTKRPLRADEILLIDTETTGLSRSAGTLAFLIGVGTFDDGALVVEQLLLRDPGDERHALARLAELLAKARLVVSYNGRSFDLPLLSTRAMLSRTRLPLGYEHVDLLHYCRRLFSARTTDRKLKTIEREVLGYNRGVDIDGALAPSVYAAFLEAQREAPAPGEATPMGAVMRHNRIDVASMAPLLARVARAVSAPQRHAEDAEELLAVGALREQFASAQQACAAYRRGLELSERPTTRRALLTALARVHRRSGDRGAARAVWERFRREFPDVNVAWVELAKHHEHHEKQLDAALALAEAAPSRDPDLQHRIARLRRRLEAKG